MVQSHPSTPAERVQWTSHMLAHSGEYGLITQLSRTLGVSRPTLYAWKATAQQALEQAFCAPPPATSLPPTLERQILTLLVEGHTSYTNIQTCLCHADWPAREHRHDCRSGAGGPAARAAVDDQPCAGQPAHAGAGRNLCQQPPGRLSQRGRYRQLGGLGGRRPAAVDADSWTLLLWLAQDRGLRWHATVSDGGDALACGLSGSRSPRTPSTRCLACVPFLEPDSAARGAATDELAGPNRHGRTPSGSHRRRTETAWRAPAHRSGGASGRRCARCNSTDARSARLGPGVAARAGGGGAGSGTASKIMARATPGSGGTGGLAGGGAGAGTARHCKRELKRLHTQVRLAQAAVLAFVAPLDAGAAGHGGGAGDGRAGVAGVGLAASQRLGAGCRRSWSPRCRQRGRPLRGWWCMPGRRLGGPAVRWRIGIASCGRIWRCIARCRRGCWRCWRSGIIIACSVVACIKAQSLAVEWYARRTDRLARRVGLSASVHPRTAYGREGGRTSAGRIAPKL